MKDKITQANFENLYADPVIKSAAKDFYALHQQSLRQILEEAGEQLPGDNPIDDHIKGLKMMDEFTRSVAFKDGAKWMRSEASKVVANHKGHIDNCWKEIFELKDTVKQLKEELARKELTGK